MSRSVSSDDKISISKEISSPEAGGAQALHPVLDEHAAARARRKFDILVLPVVSIISLLAFLDRSNLGNAKTAGMLKSLHLNAHQFSVSLTITFVPYILSEIPSNLILKRVGAQRLLPFYMAAWGLTTTFQGFVTNYSGLLACRFLIGLFEGGLIPGILLYLAAFYRRLDVHSRMALIFTAPALAGAFSGLLAFGINDLNGKGGKEGWRWIFILEGAFTVLFAILSFFLMPESVATMKWLTEEERAATLLALELDSNSEKQHEPFSWKESVLTVVTSPTMLIMTPAFFANGLSLLGLSYFAPSIVNSLGYTPSRSQLMTVPPYAAAFVVSFIMAVFSDKFKARGLVTISAGILDVIGYGMFLGSTNKHVRYGAMFFIITGAYVGSPALCAWLANNILPHYRRGTALAMIFMWANTAGIVSTWTFNDPPKYAKPATINLTFAAILILCSIGNMFYLSTVNKKRAILRAEADAAGTSEKVNEEERERERHRLGDRDVEFVYTL